MKKTTQIHMGGRHFFIDDDAFQKLNHYLESLKLHFAPDGDTGKEIVDDIEQRIAELLENKITNGKQAVNLDDVNDTINILGKVEDFIYAGNSAESHQDYDYYNRRDFRRFYRDPDNYYFGGVASGMGAYFDIDPLWIRLAFVALFLLKGAGLLIYLILWIVVPKARTTAEKLQMKGKPVNLSTIKDTVNEEYEKVRTESSARFTADRTRNALENILRAVGLVIVAIFKFIIGALGVLFLVIGSIFLAGLIMAVLGFTNFFGHVQLWDGAYLPQISSFFANSSHYYIAVISLIIVILIPIIALIYGGVKILFNVKSRHPVLRAFLLTSWILAVILFITLVIVNVPNSPIEASGSESSIVEPNDYPHMVIDVRDNISDKHITHYRVMGYRFTYSRWDDELYDDARLKVSKSEDDKMHLTIHKKIKNVDIYNSQHYLDRIDYGWELNDSVLYLDKYFHTDDDDFWMFADVDLNLRIPEGQTVVLTKNACELLEPVQQDLYCRDGTLEGKKWLMSPEGSLVQAK